MDTQESGGSRWSVVRALLVGAMGLALLVAATTRWTIAPSAQAPQPTTAAVIAAHPLEAGQVLVRQDLEEIVVSTSAMDTALIHDARQASGRRLLVSLAAGSPLVAAVLAPPAPPPGQRLVKVAIDSDHVAADVQPGAVVDVLAVADGAAPQQSQHVGRVVVLGVASVAGVTWSPKAGSTDRLNDKPPAPVAATGSMTIVTLRCDPAVARDVIWAEIYARAVRIAARPFDEPVASGGLPPAPT